MRQLIVNADDFGYNTGVNQGVVQAASAGALPSATLMATGQAWREAAEWSAGLPALGVGCHVCLVGARPVLPPAQIPSLVGADGLLLPSLGAFTGRYFAGRLQMAEVVRETAAQVDRLLEAGVRLTHLDAHKHAFILPRVHRAICQVCRDRKIPAMRFPLDSDPWQPGLARDGDRTTYRRQWLLGRLAGGFAHGFRRRLRAFGLAAPARFFGVAATGLWSPAYLEAVFTRLPRGRVSELMVHPAVMDQSMRESRSRLRESRGVELQLLLERIPALAKEHGVRLVNFKESLLC